jgi:hypothetical protein
MYLLLCCLAHCAPPGAVAALRDERLEKCTQVYHSHTFCPALFADKAHTSNINMLNAGTLISPMIKGSNVMRFCLRCSGKKHD